ncbi:MAG: hypothetical protein K8T26_01470 [Lentisphaerae bacterium]|nr:hypothetical protein [Lentisphaerota bacterium]
MQDIQQWMKQDAIPIALALKSEEMKTATYKCPLGKFSVNVHGWKLCHVVPIGMNTAMPLEQVNTANICQHFTRLISPSNHFLVPKEWGGLGELPEFIQAMRPK